jgi:hypothetical protein
VGRNTIRSSMFTWAISVTAVGKSSSTTLTGPSS